MTDPSPATESPRERRPAGRLSRPLIGPFTGRQLLAVVGAIAAVAVVLTVLTAPIGTSSPIAAPTPRPGATGVQVGDVQPDLAIGQPAPELAGTVDGRPVQLLDLDGRPVRLADFRGKPVWVNFWASWCPPCQAETPTLRKVYENHRDDGLVLLGVSVQETSPDDVRRYVETYDLAFPIGFDATSAVFKTYQAYALPTQVFIDRDGIVRAVLKGPLTEAQAEQVLAPLLGTETAAR